MKKISIMILILLLGSRALADNTELINSLIDTQREHTKETNRRLERLDDMTYKPLKTIPSQIDITPVLYPQPVQKVIVVPVYGGYPGSGLDRLKYGY